MNEKIIEKKYILDFDHNHHCVGAELREYFTNDAGSWIINRDMEGYETIKQISHVQIRPIYVKEIKGYMSVVLELIKDSEKVNITLSLYHLQKLHLKNKGTDTDIFHGMHGKVNTTMGRTLYNVVQKAVNNDYIKSIKATDKPNILEFKRMEN